MICTANANSSVSFGSSDPARSPVIDLKFGVAWKRNEYRFYAEAKNLSENDWVKLGNKHPVRADKQIKRYIETGVAHYLTGYYPKGCLIGYVVNGTVSGVLSKLNSLIARSELGDSTQIGIIVQDTSSITSMPICYSSENQLTTGPLFLRHLILQLA